VIFSVYLRNRLPGAALAVYMADSKDAWVSAMRTERYADAWTLSDRALAARDHATRDDPRLPYHERWVWDGRALDRRDVLVRCYHGLGDTIQFARFLPLLAARARSVVVEAPARLLDLLATIQADITLMPFDHASPRVAVEIDIEITELDFALRAEPDSARPYLFATPACAAGGTVGLCYGAGDWDAGRSIPASLLAPLCRQSPCITLMPEPTDLDVLNPEGCPLDMGATAALVAGVDLVITADTMIAHLAGALGKPTWLLLKTAPDWRWSPGARGTAWYPSMRLYHQTCPGEWGSVLAEVERDLTHSNLRREHHHHGPADQPSRPRFVGRVARQDHDSRDQAPSYIPA
jgi:hypothetical protein